MKLIALERKRYIVSNLFGDIDIGRKIRIISVCCKCIGIARFAYRWENSGFAASADVKGCISLFRSRYATTDSGIRVTVIDTSPVWVLLLSPHIESIFFSLILGDVLRTLHKRSFQSAQEIISLAFRNTGDGCDIGIQRVGTLAVGSSR